VDEHSHRTWTYDDLASLPDDGQRHEIIDGELVVSPSPTTRHQRVLLQLVKQFLALEQAKVATVWVAPLDVMLGPNVVVEPDLFVIRRGRRSALGVRAIHEAPDLVVEILSPSTTKHDRTRKRQIYARGGVREYWLVDPDGETVEVLVLDDVTLSFREHRRARPGDRVASVTFELEVEVSALFRDDEAAPA
jgi:Uma2 family endonuclease